MAIGFVTDYGGVSKHALNNQLALTDLTVWALRIKFLS